MKKALLFFLTFVLLAVPVFASADAPGDEQDIRQALQQYFDMRYAILSSLVFDDGIKEMLSPEVADTGEAINEADVLDTIVKSRRLQVNDLRFSNFSYELVYGSIAVDGDKAWISLIENYSLYFNCAPTVKNSAGIEHALILSKNGGKWLVLKDDYADTDGIKKKLSTYFMIDRLSKEEAKEKVVAEAEAQSVGRIEKLQNIMEGTITEGLSVYCAGKPVAFAAGQSSRIDSNLGVTPVLDGSTVLIPVRFFAERIGAEVAWNEADSAVRINGGGHVLEFKIGEKSISVDGRQIPLDVPVKKANDRTLLPAGALADAFGMKAFQDDSGLVIISSTGFDSQANRTLIDRLVEYYGVSFTKVDFPRIDGSTATYPLSIEMGKELLGLDELGAKGFITHNTTHNAYVNLIDKKADIIFVTQPSPEELELAAQNGVELEVVPVCKEGFVFLVNKNNPVNNLKAQQVQDIYKGIITNWKEVGGEDSRIIPYQREANSGSQTIMENTVMNGMKLMQPPKEEIVYGMGQLIDRVADYSNAKNALGYSVYYYATTMYTSRSVKLLAINGVAPDKQTIKDDTYPFVVSYYAVLRKDEPQDSNARKLLKWLLGDEGQSVVDRSGFVPVK